MSERPKHQEVVTVTLGDLERDWEKELTDFETASRTTGRFLRPEFFSSPEPLGSQGELIVYPSSRRLSVRPSVRPPFSKIFFSETAWSIKAKFMWSLLGKGERKFI